VTQFSQAWSLSRQRFLEAIQDLSGEQLNFRMFPSCLTLGEAALHVAGVEVSFASQLLDSPLDEFLSQLKACATEGVVNENPFPFEQDAIDPGLIFRALEVSKRLLQPVIEAPSEEILSKQIVSALGPIITGEGALTRLAFHSAYHQGQAHLIITSPTFPRGA